MIVITALALAVCGAPAGSLLGQAELCMSNGAPYSEYFVDQGVSAPLSAEYGLLATSDEGRLYVRLSSQSKPIS